VRGELGRGETVGLEARRPNFFKESGRRIGEKPIKTKRSSRSRFHSNLLQTILTTQWTIRWLKIFGITWTLLLLKESTGFCWVEWRRSFYILGLV